MRAVVMLPALSIILAANPTGAAYGPAQATVSVCFVPAEQDCFIQILAAIGAAQHEIRVQA